MEWVHFFISICIVIGVTVSGWIVTVRVRRRMKKSLGRSATSLELVSFKTWMKVEEAEEQRKESWSIHPK
jgi:ABC-type bacteriocin/lantibiotic exporter with double-glycine peptidase domain